jgi:hypothetical protein
MTIVAFQKRETLDHPGIKAAAGVLRHFLDDMAAILEPLQFGPRRYGEDGLFALFAMISGSHRRSIPGCRENASGLRLKRSSGQSQTAPAGAEGVCDCRFVSTRFDEFIAFGFAEPPVEQSPPDCC